jgi:hypothetical protein
MTGNWPVLVNDSSFSNEKCRCNVLDETTLRRYYIEKILIKEVA